MKKTLFTAFLAVASVTLASGAVKTFQLAENGTTQYTGADIVAGPSGNAATPLTLPYTDGTTATVVISGGNRFFANSGTNVHWANTAALAEFNTFSGLSVAAADLYGHQYFGSGQGAARNTLNITLGTDYKAGDTITLYTLVCNPNNALTSVNVSGLSNATVTYATGGGDGFASTVSGTAAGQPVIVKYEGTLATDGATLSLYGNENKTLFSTASFGYVDPVSPDPNPGTGNIPEPATATLSLLALAGLAARRRRK